MGKKGKSDVGKNVRKPLLSSPLKLMKEISASSGLEYTRAVDTIVMENTKDAPLKVSINRGGKSIATGNVAWISGTPDGKVHVYLDNKKYLYPTNENVKNAFFHKEKKKKPGGELEIEVSAASTKCVVCSKDIEIYDEAAECPLCGAQGHQPHLEEWVRMKNECSKCQAKLKVDESGSIVPA